MSNCILTGRSGRVKFTLLENLGQNISYVVPKDCLAFYKLPNDNGTGSVKYLQVNNVNLFSSIAGADHGGGLVVNKGDTVKLIDNTSKGYIKFYRLTI